MAAVRFFDVERAREAIRRLEQDRLRLSEERARLRYDEGTWKVVEDDAVPPESVDLDRFEAEVLNAERAAHAESPALVPVRDWLIASEILFLKRIRDRSTLFNWRHLKHLPSRPDERPWPAEGPVPIDVTEGEQFARYWVPAIQPGFWTTRLMRMELAELLARWPDNRFWVDKNGEPRARCHNTLVLPEPYAARWFIAGLGAPDYEQVA